MTSRRPHNAGSIETRPDGRYRARFRFADNGPRETVGTYATKAEAQGALDAILAEYQARGSVRGITLRVLGETVLRRRKKEGYRSVKSEESRWAAYVETWPLCDDAIKTISRADVRDWLAGLAARGLATQTRRNALNLLRSVFDAAIDAEYIDANPCADMRVKAKGATKETSTHLSQAELADLLSVATDPAVALAAYTGLRQGEMRSLQWRDVDLPGARLTVRYGAPGLPTKSGKVRHVPLLSVAVRALESIAGRSGLVFPSQAGVVRPKGAMVLRRLWDKWLLDAGIARKVRWHDLRHTCATLLLSGAFGRKWSLEEVRDMLGHSTVRVTERYARTASLAESAAAEMRGADARPNLGPIADWVFSKKLNDLEEVRMGFEPTYDGFANRLKSHDSVHLQDFLGCNGTYIGEASAYDWADRWVLEHGREDLN